MAVVLGVWTKKIDCLTTINLVNLKSNTMKNTPQRYEICVVQHNFQAKNCISLTLFNPYAHNMFHHVNGSWQLRQNLAVKNCLRVICYVNLQPNYKLTIE